MTEADPDAERWRPVLGPATDVLRRYADFLVSDGVPRGLIGPREAPRLWERHLLNSAAVGELLPDSGRLLDIGSGAGLPGLVLAVLAPGLEVVLLDATRRRTDFLTEAVTLLGLDDRVRVVWGRAEQVAPVQADVVVARAVAPLATLAGWAAPHVVAGGRLLAMKGESAAEELTRDMTAVRSLGWTDPELVTVATPGTGEQVRVLRWTMAASAGAARRRKVHRLSSSPRPVTGRTASR